MLGYREWSIIPLSVIVLIACILNRPYFFIVFCIILCGVILWNQCIKIPKKIKKPIVKISIKDMQADKLVVFFKPALEISFLKSIQDFIEQKIKIDILRSGSAQNPRILGIKSVLYVIISSVILIPTGIVLFFLYDQIFIGIVFVPGFAFGFYFLALKVKTADRKTAIQEELASFVTLASILESVNVSLFSTFLIISKTPENIFSVMRNEGRRIKNLTTLGKSPTDAIMELADSHPSTTFRDFLEGYISCYNTGGSDTSKYLAEQAHRFFKFMQARMVSYTKQADMIAQVILTVMLLLPMMGLSMMFFATGHMAGMLILILIVMFPLITVILVAVVQNKQPKSRDSINVSWVVFVAGVISAILSYMIQNSIWEAIGIGVIVGCFSNVLFTRSKFAHQTAIESPLPEFMRQITRFKNIGIDIMHSITHMRREILQRRQESKSPKFNHTFDDLVDKIYMGLIRGQTLEQTVAKLKINSWNGRLVFFILGKVHESGGGTAKILDDITRWVTEYADAKKEMIINLRASLLTAFIGPILMVLMSVVSNQLASKFEQSRDAASRLGSYTFTNAPTADIAGFSETLIMVSVICMGIILSKINYFTIKHTLFTGIITAFTMILLYAVPYFPEFGF